MQEKARITEDSGYFMQKEKSRVLEVHACGVL